jgi:hypothetical protein
MTIRKLELPCPQCGEDIKLRKVSPPDNPIRKYPAVRPCPSCGLPLRFDLPGWVVPSLVALTIALVVFAIYLVNATDAPWLQPLLQSRDRGSRRLGGVLLGVPVGAIVLPVMVALFRLLMRIEKA